jgi:hypothetical protein
MKIPSFFVGCQKWLSGCQVKNVTASNGDDDDDDDCDDDAKENEIRQSCLSEDSVHSKKP